MAEERTQADRAFAEFRRTGEPERLGDVYDLVAPELLRVALQLSRNAPDAEDALQATFLAAIERAASFDPSRRVLPWLAGILALEIRRIRERSSRAPERARLPDPPATSPECDAERAEITQRLEAAVQELPEAFRPVLILRVRHGLTSEQIAEALGRPAGTVRSQLARGLELLRRSLPASLAGSLAVLGLAPTRGLAAVRDSVIAHAAAQHVSTSIVASLVRMLAVKKIAALALIAVVGLWFAWPESTPTPASRPVAKAATPVLAQPAPSRPEVETREVAALPTGSDERSEAPAPIEAARPAAPTTAMLRVVALDEATDEPVAGEIVLVQVPPEHWRAEESRVLRTDERGVVELEGLPPLRAYVRLLRGGEDSISLVAGTTLELRLRVRSGVTVEGQVVDEGGIAVAEAEIWVSERYRTNMGHLFARAGRDGRFRVGSIGLDHYLGARKSGFAPSGQRSAHGSKGDSIPMTLVLARAGVRVRGRVLDETGAPIAGASVLLGEENPALSERLDDGTFAFDPPPLRGTSDADGAFELDGAPIGLAPLQARARGFGPFAGEFATEGADRVPLEIRMTREARITGRVVDDARKPLFGVWVHTGEPERFASSSAYSRLDGTFALEGLAPGTHRVRAEHPDLGGTSIELELAPGEARTWEPVLSSKPRIFGHLVDGAGAGREGWTIVALPNGDASRRARSERVDADGSFSIGDLENEPHTLWIQRPEGWRDFPVRIVEGVRPSTQPLELRVSDDDADGGRIVARVLGPHGESVAGAELQVWHLERSLWRTFVADGASGALAIEHVPPGTCELELRHPEFPWKRVGPREIRAGETLDLGAILFDEPGRLRVRVSGVAPDRVAALTAVISNASNRESGVVRADGGELRSGALAPGAHTLVVRGDFVTMQRADFEIAAGAETTLSLAFEPCGMRVARFVLPEGAAAPGWLSCRVQAADGRQVWYGGMSGPDLLDVRVSVPPGDYQLFANGAGGVAAQGAFSVTGLSGQDPPARFELRPER